MSALASCGVFVVDKVARERGIPVAGVTATASGDFDPRGVKGEPADPRVQRIRVEVAVRGTSLEEANALVAAMKTRCPVFTTLVRAVPIELQITVSGASVSR